MAKETQVKRTICYWCQAWCRVLVHVRDNHLVDVQPDTEFPPEMFSQYWRPILGCPRQRVSKEFFYHPSHLNYPLKRAGDRGEGKWQRISWAQAMDEIAEKLDSLKAKYGAETVVTTRGTYRTQDEYRSRFMNLFGSPNITGHSAICYGPRAMISRCIIGCFPYPGLSDKAKTVMIWGNEPSQSWPRIWRLLRELKKGGNAKFICIDPRGGSTPQISNLWLQPRPGTDCALAMAMINIIIKEDLYDKEFVAKWCHGFNEIKERAAEYDLEKVEAITWVPADKIIQAARMYAQSKPAAILDGEGLEQLPNSEVLHARYILTAITGNIDVEGGDSISGPHPKYINDREIELEEALPPEQRRKQMGSDIFRLYAWPGNELVQKEQMRVWGKPTGGWSNDCQAHPSLIYRAMITGEPYPIRAFITAASNPLIKSANVKLVYKALKALDLHVVLDYWLTPTAEIADYVLPAAGWLERPFIFNSSNNSAFFFGGERALPSTVEGEYDRRTNFDFWRELGIRLGQAKYWPWKTDEEAYDYRLAPLGYTFKEFMDRGGIEAPPLEYKKYERLGFSTPTGKVELASTILEKLGYDPLPKYVEPLESPVSCPELAEEYPLILITGGRHQPYFHSEHRQIDSLRRMRPDPIVQINPQTANALGIKESDWVWIETPRGRIKQKCECFEGIDPRVVHSEHGWWFPEEPGEEPWLHGCWWSNINVCTDDNPDNCGPIVGSWPLRTGLCKLYKCKEYKQN